MGNPSPAVEPAHSSDDRVLLFKAIDLQNQGAIDQAEALFNQYLATHPHDGAAIYSLSVIYFKRGDQAQALTLLDQGVKVAPTFAPVWFAHGSALQAAGRFEEALASYDQALAIKPDYLEVLLNSGVPPRCRRRHAAALDRFQRVLAINPNYESALGNSGIILTEFKRSAEAIAIFERLLKINPHYDYGWGLLSYERLHICDWTDFEVVKKQIIDGVRAGERTCKSLPLMAISDSASDQHQCARAFATQRFPASNRPLWTGERYKHKKIRLAYVSPDLREHPVGHLMCGIFERHDKNRFETIAISLGPDDNSRLRARMLKSFDQFIDVRNMGSRQIAELMREKEIDIAVDLAGYTADSRTEVFAHRPAPIQVNYLGYPGTLGVSYMDYILADRHVIPEGHHQHYDEQVVYLPDTYLPTDAGIKIAERTPTRAECGLPDTGVVFCSFSHDYKISPPIFDLWMRLLNKVPGSVLWLMSRSAISQANLRLEAQKRGVAPERLIFAGRVPMVEDHLARYRQADVFLDTHPYNAHTTSADALMAGLPVVTCMGQAFPSRVAGSVLHAVGMPELVTDSFEGYEALALKLALDPELLRQTKNKLAANMASQPLFDTDRFCSNIEAAYIAMWRQHQLGDARDALSGHISGKP